MYITRDPHRPNASNLSYLTKQSRLAQHPEQSVSGPRPVSVTRVSSSVSAQLAITMLAFRSLVAAVATLSLAGFTQAWNVELPPCTSAFTPFVYSGCFQNGAPGSPGALVFRSPLDSANMTVELCTAECKGDLAPKLLPLTRLAATSDDELTR